MCKQGRPFVVPWRQDILAANSKHPCLSHFDIWSFLMTPCHLPTFMLLLFLLLASLTSTPSSSSPLCNVQLGSARGGGIDSQVPATNCFHQFQHSWHPVTILCYSATLPDIPCLICIVMYKLATVMQFHRIPRLMFCVVHFQHHDHDWLCTWKEQLRVPATSDYGRIHSGKETTHIHTYLCMYV